MRQYVANPGGLELLRFLPANGTPACRPVTRIKILAGQLYRLYYDELRRYLAPRLGCAERAAEVAQEAYLRLLSSAGDRELEHPRAFLYRTAINLSVDEHRMRMAAPEHISRDAMPDALAETPDLRSPDVVACSRQRLGRINDAVEALPPRCREVFVLHKFEGMAYADIAARLAISVSMVEKHMMHALAECRRAVGTSGGTGRRGNS